MNEVEKLYKNAGITPRRNWWCRRFDETSIADCNGTRNGEKECSKCEYGYIRSEKYPPFTAEKQLNIIKFLGKIRDFHTCGRYCTALNSEGDSVESLQDKFEESLVGLINKLWTDLSEEEKQQVKGILE